MGQCSHCQAELGVDQVVLDRRVEVMTFTGETPTATVLCCIDSVFFCSMACWLQQEQAIILQLQLKQTHPYFDVISDCCRCGAAVDRRQAYVMFALMAQTVEAKPWLTTCTVHSAEEFAVLCRQCEVPNFETAEEAVDEPVRHSVGVLVAT